MIPKILFVDDDPSILAAYQRNLRKRFAMVTTQNCAEALMALEQQGPFAVVVADMQMPGMNGIEFLTKAQEKAPDTVRMMLTGNADQRTAVEAVNQGNVFRFLTKPCPPEVLTWALEAGLQHYRLITSERQLLENTLSGAVTLLMELLSNVEPQSHGRAQKIRDYMRLFTGTFKASQPWELEMAALLSQIGQVTLPPSVNDKTRQGGNLNAAEQQLLLRLPDIGANLVAHIPRLETVAQIIRYQNKNYDGSGFPQDNCARDEIPIGARILHLLSDLVQLELEGVPKSHALEMMQKRPGCYDPRILDAAFACFDIYLTHPTPASTAPQTVRLKNLQVGQTLLSNIETQDGLLILTAGTQLTSMLLEKLANFAQLSGIKEPIYVEG